MRVPGRLIRGSVRPDRRSALRFASLRWAALPIVDRRWTLPMSAVALGFGLFVGVAIGPGTQGSFGDSPATVVQVAAPSESGSGSGGRAPGASGGRGSNAHSKGSAAGELSAPSAPSAPPSTFAPPAPVTPSVPIAPVTPTPITPPPPISSPAPPSTTSTTTDPAETSTELTGTVVHVNREATSYTISADHSLVAIHSHRPPAVGDVVDVKARPLANGTYGENDRRATGSRGQAEFAGTVSFRDPATATYAVSAPGVSLLVRAGERKQPPRVGARVEVKVRFADHPEALPVTAPGHQGCGAPPKPPKPPAVALEQVRLDVTDAERAPTTDLEVVVEGVCRDTRTLIASADDVRESGRDIQVSLPSSLRLAEITNGQVLRLSASIAAGGALTAETLSADGDSAQADEPALGRP